MKVLVADIKAKITELPANVRDLVTLGEPGFATVQSRSTDEVHQVHLQTHMEDPGDHSILNATCPCDARSLCWHVVAFYAIYKDLVPKEGFLPKTPAEKPSDQQQEPSPVDPVETPTERDTEDLRRLAQEVIVAFAAWFAEVEKHLK